LTEVWLGAPSTFTGTIKGAIFGSKSKEGRIMAHSIFSTTTASISELKRNPMGTVSAGEGFPVAILNRNEPAFYCIPAKTFEAMLDRLEDAELNAIADARAGQEEIAVTLDEL